MSSGKMNIRRFLATLEAGAGRAEGGDAESNAPDATPPERPKPKFSRMTLWGLLGLLPLGGCLLYGLMYISLDPVAFSFWYCGYWDCEMSPITMVVRALPLIGVTWTTCMGILAVVRIGFSEGRLTGLWLAVLEALEIPIIIFLVMVLITLSSLCE